MTFGQLALTWVVVIVSSCGSSPARSDLERDFADRQREFEDLAKYFEAVTSQSAAYSITVGVDGNSLVVEPRFGNIADRSRLLGGRRLERSSPRLDSALTAIRWDFSTLQGVRSRLDATGYSWIRTIPMYGNPVQIYDSPKGWFSCAFHVYPKIFADTTRQEWSFVGDSGFAGRTAVICSGAL